MREIAGAGTPEEHWRGWLAQADLPVATPPLTDGRTPRVVVLAAHPDDEVLGAGGLLHRLAADGWQVDVVWASDGEGSHPGSTVMSAAELGARRREESLTARDRLGLAGATTWLGLPDSGLVDHEPALIVALRDAAAGADLLLAPWAEDGHPDHEVCGRAARAVAAAHSLPLWELPIWAWHWGTGDELGPRWGSARVVRLTQAELRAKADAVGAFTSQVHPLGERPEDRAVLPPEVLVRFERDVEVVLCGGSGPGR